MTEGGIFANNLAPSDILINNLVFLKQNAICKICKQPATVSNFSRKKFVSCCHDVTQLVLVIRKIHDKTILDLPDRLHSCLYKQQKLVFNIPVLSYNQCTSNRLAWSSIFQNYFLFNILNLSRFLVMQLSCAIVIDVYVWCRHYSQNKKAWTNVFRCTVRPAAFLFAVFKVPTPRSTWTKYLSKNHFC